MPEYRFVEWAWECKDQGENEENAGNQGENEENYGQNVGMGTRMRHKSSGEA